MLDKHFPVIFLTLGRDCNFNCKYCLQDEGFSHQRSCIEKPKLSEKVIRFLDEYKYGYTKIMLWGGEPLLYMDSIKFLLERYGNKFSWGTITNGSLLTKEVIDLFEKYNVSLTVSHDGEATENTRGVDVLKNERIKNLLLNYKNFTGFSSVFSSANDNYRKLFQYHANEGFSEKNTGVDMIFNTSDTCALFELADIDEERYKETLKELFEGYEKQELYGDSKHFKEWQIVHHYIECLNRTINRTPNPKYCFYNVDCSTCRDMLNIDYNGDVYICHNSTHKIATVEDDYETIRQGLVTYLETWFSPKCKECSAFGMCQGACLLLTEKGQEKFCRLRRIQIGMLCDWLTDFKKRIERGAVYGQGRSGINEGEDSACSK